MENYYNLIILGFIVALTIVAMLWAFNTVRHIGINKNFCADALTGIAKLWRRAQFIPEDAKESESLYLYRDFLKKFEGGKCKFPLVLKNGGVRVMTRKEYDASFVGKPVHVCSILLILASLLVAGLALWVNITMTKNLVLGIILALILPVEQLILAFFLSRVVREKNLYRDAIFVALKENSVNFLTITKPYIIVDAYPHKFGKAGEPLYTVNGDLSPEQVDEIRDFVMQQKKKEVTAAFDAVSHAAPTTPLEPVVPVTPVDDTANQTEMPAVETVETVETVENVEPVADVLENNVNQEDKTAVLGKFLDEMMIGEIQRAEQEAANKGEPFEFTNEEIMQIMTAEQDENGAELGAISVESAPSDKAVAETVASNHDELLDFNTPIQELAKAPIPDENAVIVEPDEDDFSLEAIGLALDAEIAKRVASGKK